MRQPMQQGEHKGAVSYPGSRLMPTWVRERGLRGRVAARWSCFRRNDSGQMTIELAVVFPVVIVIAVLGYNALEYFSLCASFDRAVHNEVRIQAVSAPAGQDVVGSCSAVEVALRSAFQERDNLDIAVSCGQVAYGLERFTAQMEYHPTLFGLSLRSEIWGVALPPLTHCVEFTVDCYRPGVVI